MRIASFLLVPLLAFSACRPAPAPTTTTTTQQPAAAVGGEYKTGGTCAHGSPENPTCISTLTLGTDGKGSFIGDDIVESATWTQAGKLITVAIGSRSMELTVNADGTLVDAHGSIWKRSP